MEIKDRIWKQFMQTGDPGLFMLYKTLADKHKTDVDE